MPPPKDPVKREIWRNAISEAHKKIGKKEKIPNCTCLKCGKKFHKYPSEIKEGKGKYCSKECAYSSDIWKQNIGKGNSIPPNRICKICGTPFKASPSAIKKGRGIYCSPECWHKDLKVKVILDMPNRSKSGRRFNKICKMCGTPFYGQSAESKYCSRECMRDDPEFREHLSLGKMNRRRPSEATRKKMSFAQKGLHAKEKNPNWKGGMYALRKLVQNRPEYWEWRKQVFERDHYTDWFSGCSGNLVAHHIVPFSVIVKRNGIKTIDDAMECKELFDIGNGVTMLKSNHSAYHEMWGTTEATA